MSGTARVRAGGTAPALPVVRCTPPKCSSWMLTNVTTGAYVTVVAKLSGSAEVAIDMATQRCTVNGADHAVTIGSDFFSIEGTTTIRASSGTALLEWDERWL